MSEQLNEIVEFKGHKLKLGRYLFNKCLPEDYRVIDEVVDEKLLNIILNDIAMRYPPKVVIDTLDNIKSLGFTQSTIRGYTLTIDDLYSKELMEISESLTGVMNEDMKILNSDRVMDILKTFSFKDYIESGARGSWEQIKQLVLSRGYVSDSKGIIRPDLIRSSLLKGLNQKEFFDSCWGARKGLLDTALSTGVSGYLTRQLIYSCVFVVLDESLDDCGSTDYMRIYVRDEDMARSLLWRYFRLKDRLIKITTTNYKNIVGKVIDLRSPIYCKSEKICKRCYGDLHKILHSNQIGIIATQAIGEITTQLVLRTFHLSGVAKQKEESDSHDDIISGLGVANKLFHNPESVIKINQPSDLVNATYSIFNEYKKIHMIHYETIISAMMWSGDNQWRLMDDRDSKEYKWISILNIPSKSSWLLGVAFSNLKAKLLDGLINKKSDNCNALSRLFRL
jgi:DNA-directed RNA polymerase subunit beta'